MKNKKPINPMSILLIAALFGTPVIGMIFAIFLYCHGGPASDCIAIAAMPIAMTCMFLYMLDRQDKYHQNYNASKAILGMTKSVNGNSAHDMLEFMEQNKAWIHADLRGYTTEYDTTPTEQISQ